MLSFNFQLYFQFLTILHRVFTQDIEWKKIRIICILFIYVFCCLFLVLLFHYIDSILLRRWAVLQCVIFGISYGQGLPGIVFICLFVPFLIMPRTPTITDTVMPHFFNFYFQIFKSSNFIILFHWYMLYMLTL